MSTGEVKRKKMRSYLQGEVQAGAAAEHLQYVTVPSVMYGWHRRVKVCCELEYAPSSTADSLLCENTA